MQKLKDMKMAFGFGLMIFLILSDSGAAANGGKIVDSVVTVVSLDAQGQPGLQGLGVVVGRDGQVLTSASLFAENRHGVIKTGNGVLHVIQNLAFCSPPQYLAIIQVETDGLQPVPLASSSRVQHSGQVQVPLKEGNGFRLQENQINATFPFSPRLTMLKIKSTSQGQVPGTPVFNRQGELMGMLHSLPGSGNKGGVSVFLSLDRSSVPLNNDGMKNNGFIIQEERDGSGGQAVFWEGVAASYGQEWRRAQEKFTASLALTADLAEAFYGRGVACYHLGNLPGALRDLREARRRLPNYALASFWLGKTWQRQGNQSAALQNYEQAVQKAPDLGEAWFCLGELAYRRGDLARAKECLEKAGDDFPQPARRWWYLGKVAEAQKLWPEALAAFKRVAKLDPAWADAYLEAGKLAVLNLNKPREATALLQEAIRLGPDQSVARYYLCLAYMMVWNTSEAWKQYFTLRKENPVLAAHLVQALESGR